MDAIITEDAVGIVRESQEPHHEAASRKGSRRRERQRAIQTSVGKEKKRKAQQLLQARQQKASRASLFAEVAQTNLTADQVHLMRSSATLGRGAGKGTLRERLSEELRFRRAGIKPHMGGDDSRLIVDTLPAMEANGGPEPQSVRDNRTPNSVESVPEQDRRDTNARQERTFDPKPAQDRRPEVLSDTSSVRSEEGSEPERSTAQPKVLSTRPPSSAPAKPLTTTIPSEIRRSTRTRKARVTTTSRKAANSVFDDRYSAGQNHVTEELKRRILELLEPDQQGSGESEEATEDPETDGNSDDLESESDGSLTGNLSSTEPNDQNMAHDKQDSGTAAEPRTPKLAKFVIHPNRASEIAKARLELPVCGKEQEIMEAIAARDIVVISGSTGSGKTTQVPQFLYEAGYGDAHCPQTSGIVAVVQPRRVAVMSCASRVAEELNVALGSEVGYQIRHHSKLSDATKIKFVTDGVLLRELENDFLMTRYSAILVDEAHERALNSDLLLVLLSRAVEARRDKRSDSQGPLKLIVMSATMNLEGLFEGDCPLFPSQTFSLVDVESRQFPVTIHFSRRTPENYEEECFKKVCKLHRKLPPGDVLVFVTGRQEAEGLCHRLCSEFPDPTAFIALPLYAMLPEASQRRVFLASVPTRRKVVVATNVAETSITIPGVAYVIDSGKAKERVHTPCSNGSLSGFEIEWISKASAAQRAGRAGRTGPGHCYRLYSSAVFQNEFQNFRVPEVQRIPADSLILRLLSIGITDIYAFPLPSRPERRAVENGARTLALLGATTTPDGTGLTETGRAMADLPLPPRIGRFVLEAKKHGCLRYAARIAGYLSVGDLFQRGAIANKSTNPEVSVAKQAAEAHQLFDHPLSEVFRGLRAISAAEFALKGVASNTRLTTLRRFCTEYFLHFRNLRESLDIADQVESMFLGREARASMPGPPTPEDETLLRQALLSGFPDHVARRVPRDEARAAGVKGRKTLRTFSAPQSTMEPVFLDVLSSLPDNVEYVCFSEVLRNSSKANATLRGVTAIAANWLPLYSTSLCSFSDVRESSAVVRYNTDTDETILMRDASFGPQAWQLGTVECAFPAKCGEKLEVKRYQSFCAALLKGEVYESLAWVAKIGPEKDVESVMLSASAQRLVVALRRYGAASRRDLEALWREDKSALYLELSKLIVGDKRTRLRRQWPPKAEGAERQDETTMRVPGARIQAQ